MCQKNTLKRFFLLLSHPSPHQQPKVLSVLKDTPTTKNIFETARYSSCLSKRDVQALGKKAEATGKEYLIPIEIPRDWFIH
jgi:hypothetical protein